ncbi:MAG: Rieske 2Fe-2S domain-containing protein [Dehalococcoidia bacterium]|nr:Rieske 2Fe-2S domain-containing protein [Dehalococcoidia bacterium]MDP7469854.1 Rieske 2Fe-2S domain-containing protein [Dehalococcoidia bacterium]
MANNTTGKIDRRRFMGLMWWGATGVLALQTLGATVLSLWPRTRAGAFGAKFDIGKPADYPIGSVTYFSQGLFYLTRVRTSDGGDGLLALYRRCTHLGCVVPWRKDEASEDDLMEEGRFNCPCHASIYDRYGVVHGGPAPRPLDLMAIVQEGDRVLVDSGNITERTTFVDSQVARV